MVAQILVMAQRNNTVCDVLSSRSLTFLDLLSSLTIFSRAGPSGVRVGCVIVSQSPDPG